MRLGPVTHAELAVQLIVDGCLPLVEGAQPRGDLPTNGVQLTDAQRAQLDLIGSMRPPEDGRTFFYPVGGDGVFMDLNADLASVWFKGGDAGEALSLLERALKQSYPQLRFVEERVHPDFGDTFVRFYMIDLPAQKFAHLEVIYTKAGALRPQFVTRIRALMKPN